MAKPELGTKRVCLSCGAKFYDLQRDPIVCPSCEAVFEIAREKAVPAKPVPKKKAEPAEEKTEAPEETAGAEVISLQEADDSDDDDAAVGDPNVDVDDDDDVPDLPDLPDDDVEIDDEEDSDKFLEDDDDEGDDVSGILGDVDAKTEET